MRFGKQLAIAALATAVVQASLPAARQLAQQAELEPFAGTWVLRIEQRNVIVLTLVMEGNNMSGSLQRPVQFDSAGGGFANLRGVRNDSVVIARLKNGALHFVTRNANDPQDEEGFVMKLEGDRAEVAFDDSPRGTVAEPYTFERAAAGAKLATDWEPNRLYLPGDSDVPCAEMKALFAEDQRVRTAESIDWNAVGKSDAERRHETGKLLAQGALRTGKDYEEAAFVFQHGDTSNDYLLAHALAMVAVSKGDAAAIWIAAATLDRYLQHVNQKQIFGTQYSSGPNHVWTQEPYDRELISEALRRQLGVPPQAIQAEQLKAYQAQK